MKRSAKKSVLLLALIFSLSLAIASCGGGGGGNGGGQGGGDLSTINGRVADVVMATMAPAAKKPYILAKIKDFFAISKSAKAQASLVSDIMVVALDGDNVIDDTITGPDGSFQLSVFSGHITLLFVTPDFEVSTTIVVPADGTVSIIVVLQPGQVTQVTFQGGIELEFSGIITEINCPLITVNGMTVVDTSFADIKNLKDDSDLSCEQLLDGDKVEVRGVLDEVNSIVIAEEVKVDFDGDVGNGDEDFVCTKVVGGITVDNVVVPDGETCTLNDTRVEGNVFVLTNATLSTSGVHVDGNIQTEGADAVNVGPGSIVGGNIQIVQGGSAWIDQVVIDGDLQLFQNRGELLATQNTVGGNMQVFENTGGVTILNNNIAENLQCKENNPPPTGGGNIAGDKEDQCAGL